jgi:hypothetical protein
LRIGSAGWASLFPLLLTFVCACFGVGASAAVAHAEGCPNERLRGRDGYALQLPDCRAYEQVSPVDKNFTDALGFPGMVQSSPSGEAVSFFSVAPFPGVTNAASVPTYLSTRDPGGWSTQGLAPAANPAAAGGSEEGLTEGLTEDLSEALILVEPGLEAGLAPGVYSYLRDGATGSFRLLGPGPARFADAAAGDSRIIFESSEQLLPDAAPNVINLYEWAAGRLSVAGILPPSEGDKAPSEGSLAGPGGPALGGVRGGATGKFYTQDTISADGSRIFFSDAGTGRIYMREPEAERTIPVSAGPAYWRAATADGNYVFYTEGEDLYRFDVSSETREALTSGAAGVLGTLGIASENGAYVYFVATGVLADNENGNSEKAEAGKANLYEWHDSETLFIARLGTKGSDPADWHDFLHGGESQGPAEGEKASRVTADGTAVLFASQAQLTSYDNAKHDELYLYEAPSDKLICVSCNPDGVPATSETYLTSNGELGREPGARAFLTRNLSKDSRVFFQTQEALLASDTNEQTDVYEWEAAGEGTCAEGTGSYSAASGGCLYLISTGESDKPSYFGDASADGSNIFFFTRQSLVGQDQDENEDLYDARVEGGIAAQNQPPTASCTGEGCLGPVDPSPVFDAPSSTTFAGVGNPTPQPADIKSRPLTRAHKLARALKACRKLSRKKRGSCEARARKRYGKRATKSARVPKSVQKRNGR